MAEYQNIRINQARGPSYKFEGVLIADTQFETRGNTPLTITLELWETKGGAWVAASHAEAADGKGYQESRAMNIPPGGDEMDRMCAVMDFFDWENRARSMVREQLKWRFVKEIA